MVPWALASSPGAPPGSNAERRTCRTPSPHRGGRRARRGAAIHGTKRHFCFRPARSLGSLLSRFASQRDFKRVLLTDCAAGSSLQRVTTYTVLRHTLSVALISKSRDKKTQKQSTQIVMNTKQHGLQAPGSILEKINESSRGPPN